MAKKVKTLQRSEIRTSEEMQIYAYCMFGFHARTISEKTGLTIPQVYSFCHRYGLSLRDYRNGKTSLSVHIISAYSIKSINSRKIQQLEEGKTSY